MSAGRAGDVRREVVPVELALLVDTSGSVSTAEYVLQRNGYVEAFRDPEVGSLIESVGGVAVAIATDLSFNPLSFSAAMTSNLFSGLRAVLSKANLERTKQTAPELFGAATIGAACILAPLAFMVEGSKLSVLDDLDTNRVALQVALSGLFHCVFRCPWSFLQRARLVRHRRGSSLA